MLQFHFLNVGHGDSTVIELETDAGSVFAVVDSFKDSGGTFPALEFLQQRNAERLAFIALTHPHADHFVGLGTIGENFVGKVDSYFTFPVHRTPEKLRQLAERYKSPESLPTAELAMANLEFLKFILAARDSGVWEDCAVSAINRLHVPGMPGVTISALLPPAKVKGEFLDGWVSGKIGASSARLNDLSMALMVEYAGRQVIICGDATHSNITFMKGRWSAILDPIAVKIPHHSSRIDCASSVLDTLFPADSSVAGDRYAFISANGKSHPSSDVLTDLVERGVKPYCTNLATRCGGVARHVSRINAVITPELRGALSVFANEPARPRPCQGNTCLTILKNGDYSVAREHQNICPLRGDYDLFTAAAV